MKLAIFSLTDPSSLVEQLESLGHVTAVAAPRKIAEVIYRFRPHAILVYSAPHDPFVRMINDIFARVPNQRILLCQPDDPPEVLVEQLKQVRNQVDHSIQQPMGDLRTVYFDSSFGDRLTRQKLCAFQPNGKREKLEQERLLRILTQAESCRQAARQYLQQAEHWSLDETREVAYRLLHGSLKAPVFAQEQVGRWLSVMAYYVPGVDSCYLPTPGDAIYGHRWAFDGASPECQYAFGAVGAFGFNRRIFEAIELLLAYRFRPKQETMLTHAGLALNGVCSVLREVARAHVDSVDIFLSQEPQKVIERLAPRESQRRHQCFCEFWGFFILRDWFDPLREALEAFRAGERDNTIITIPPYQPPQP